MSLSRYHIDVFIPEWSRDSVIKFFKSLPDKLVYTKHSKAKLKKLSKVNKSIVTSYIESFAIIPEILIDYVFEFYSINEVIEKICLRIPIAGLSSELIIVISSVGGIVTFYLNDSEDKHLNLNTTLYVKENEMNKKSVLYLYIDEEEADNVLSDGKVVLDLRINSGKKNFTLFESDSLDDSDMEDYQNQLEVVANQAILISNATNISIHVDDSVYKFIEGKEDEVTKFINQLVMEL